MLQIFACVVLLLQFRKTSRVQKVFSCFSGDFVHQMYVLISVHTYMEGYLGICFYSGFLVLCQFCSHLLVSHVLKPRSKRNSQSVLFTSSTDNFYSVSVSKLHMTQNWEIDFLQKRISTSFSKLLGKELKLFCIFFSLHNISAVFK